MNGSGLRALIALAAAIAGLASQPALACSCRPITRAQAIAASQLVFEGRVLRVRREGRKAYADIEMSRMLKGTAPRVVEVETPADTPACGYPFRVGQRLTVGARFSQQLFSTNLCTMVPLNPR